MCCAWFSPTPSHGKSRCIRLVFWPAKNELPDHKSSHVESALYWGGRLGAQRQSHQKKVGFFWVFFFCFFLFFFFFFWKTPLPPLLYPKRYLLNGIYTCLIYVELALQCGGIFFQVRVPQQTPAASMENIYHGCSASREYFDAVEWCQVPGGSQGDVIPTVTASGSLPDQTEILMCHPDSRWSPILANYPYWECLWA